MGTHMPVLIHIARMAKGTEDENNIQKMLEEAHKSGWAEVTERDCKKAVKQAKRFSKKSQI